MSPGYQFRILSSTLLEYPAKSLFAKAWQSENIACLLRRWLWNHVSQAHVLALPSLSCMALEKLL